jgi:hypothetical protein
MHPDDPTLIKPNAALGAALLLTPTLPLHTDTTTSTPDPKSTTTANSSNHTSSPSVSSPSHSEKGSPNVTYADISMSELTAVLRPHLTLPPPHVLRYTIKPSTPSPSPITAFDISIPLPELPQTHAAFELMTSHSTAGGAKATGTPTSATESDPLKSQSQGSTSSSSAKGRKLDFEKLSAAVHNVGRECSDFNDKIADIMSNLHNSLRRREFLSTFASAPVEAFQMLIANQARHLLRKTDATVCSQSFSESERAIIQEAIRSRSILSVDGEAEKARRAEYYSGDWLIDAVDRYLTAAESQASAKMSDD